MIHNLLDRMKLPFRKNKEFLSVLYDILGFYPHDVEIYRLAFSHKSLSYHTDTNGAKDRRSGRRDKRPRSENTTKPLNNERLEYLGDAVLETVVSDILFRHFENKREGFLTSTRSKIVQRESLNRLAEQMGLEALIQAAQGTRMSHTNIGGNAFEALMGAIYLDRGFKYCHWFITHRVVGAYIDLDTVAQKEVNFKSKLLEWCQKNRINTDFRDSGGNDGERGFRSSIVLEGITVGKGSGRSKKESQQVAAKDALARMRREQKLYDSIFRAKEKRTAMEADESFALPRIDEADDFVIKGRGKDKPVLEDENGRRRNFAAGADDYQDTSDAAYDEAYGENPKYEVIDDPENESEYSDYATSIQPDEEEDVQPVRTKDAPSTKKDKPAANKDKAKPAQAKAENDEPTRTPQTKAERKRERNRTAKTIDDAVKGSKKVKAEVPAPAEPKPETAKAEVATESTGANASDDKPLSESAKRRQRRKARREAMAADEANPFDELRNERQERTTDETAPVATAEATIADVEAPVATDEAPLSPVTADNAPAAEADDELETVELHVAPSTDDAEPSVEAELSTYLAEEEPIAEESAETEEQPTDFVSEEATEPTSEAESAPATSEEPQPSAAEELPTPAEAEPIEADADEIEAEEDADADNDEARDGADGISADIAVEKVVGESEEPLTEEAEDDEATDENDETTDEDEAPSEPYDLNNSASRPRLRHISLDDFVFGATDATLYDRDEEAAPSEEANSNTVDNRRQRNSRSRRRKPASAKKAAEQSPEAEGESTKDAAKAQQHKAPKAPKNAEAKKGGNKTKKASPEDEGEAKIRADREKAAKRRAQQRRRRRRENGKGENPSAED